jgi:hypothetical protein
VGCAHPESRRTRLVPTVTWQLCLYAIGIQATYLFELQASSFKPRAQRPLLTFFMALAMADSTNTRDPSPSTQSVFRLSELPFELRAQIWEIWDDDHDGSDLMEKNWASNYLIPLGPRDGCDDTEYMRLGRLRILQCVSRSWAVEARARLWSGLDIVQENESWLRDHLIAEARGYLPLPFAQYVRAARLYWDPDSNKGPWSMEEGRTPEARQTFWKKVSY